VFCTQVAVAAVAHDGELLAQGDEPAIVMQDRIRVASRGLDIDFAPVGRETDPGFGRREAGVLPIVPRHRGAAVVT
jgi:hypothetical protein